MNATSEPAKPRTIRNQLQVVDAQGRAHVVMVESTRHVVRTPRGAIVQTGGDRFFMKETREALILDAATAKLRTADGRREFTFRIG
ncbi:MAG TPA: hypothetical protein VMR43_14035 [Variovorax sp.]|nr:hypothetical protein [Variovorax sp.]